MSGGRRVIAPVVTDINAGRVWYAPDDVVARPTHATYGDDFNGAALDAKWTVRGMTPGTDLILRAGDPFIQLLADQGDVIHQPVPAGDFEFVISHRAPQPVGDIMFCPFICDSSGNGHAWSLYQGQLYHFAITAWAYSGTVGNSGATMTGYDNSRQNWISVRRVGTSCTPRWSPDGTTWNAGSSVTQAGGQMGWGKIYPAGQHRGELYRFNVYPGPTFYVP